MPNEEIEEITKHEDQPGSERYAPVVANSPEKYREIREKLASQGITPSKLQQAGWSTYDRIDPFGPNPYSKPEEVRWNEYEQGWAADLMSGVFNTFVLDASEGLANLIPTLAQAGGSEGEWAENWINNTSDWFEKQQMIYSDSAYGEVKEFKDYFKSGKFWSTLGEGIGYVGAIAGGAGAVGAISKGAKMSKLYKAGQTAKTAGALGKVAKAGKWGGRAGSFSVGTALMYSDLYDEAKELGFESKDAARLALGTAGVVSLTEGAALEWIGKSATSWLPKEFATGALRSAVKETSKNIKGGPKYWPTLKSFSALLSRKIGSKEGLEAFKNGVKSIGTGMAKGGAIEFGQEFSQTYIEDGIKEM